MANATADCPFCATRDLPAIWRDDHLRVVSAGEPEYPGFVRVVWDEHVREMSDLRPDGRAHCLRVVLAVEQVLREMLHPDKINLASLGNQVPHLHWHVIPRFADDAHFPDAVWAAARRPGVAHALSVEEFGARLRLVMPV